MLQRDPLKTTSFGLGVLLLKILSNKKLQGKNIVIGVGGTSTNDAGCGMAKAFGYELKDVKNKEIKLGGKFLISLRQISAIKEVQKKIENRRIIAIADVENPLIGRQGSTRVYAKQKGASERDIAVLEAGMKNFSNVVKKNFGHNIHNKKMFGAGGGLTAGLKVFLNADIVSWREYFSLPKLELEKFDYIISGEGKIDSQSFYGKVVGEIYRLRATSNSKLILICGLVDEKSISNKVMNKIHLIIPIQKYFQDEKESREKVKLGIVKAAKEIKTALIG
jgi:glycerate kinase